MQSLGWLAVALCALQVTSLPVSSEISEDDTKVMKCVVEVISDTLSKPSPLPISSKCLETLRGDDRIISILRRNNLLKELQQLAAQGVSEKGQPQKKSTDLRDELSKALRHEEDKESEREKVKEISSEDSAAAPYEAREESNEKGSEKNASEEERNSVEKKEPSEHEDTPGKEEDDENKGADEALERNEIGDHEETVRADSIDNHITDEANADDLSEEKHEESVDTSQSHESHESHELKEEKELKSKTHKEGMEDYATDDHEDVRSTSEGVTLADTNSKASQEDTEDETQTKGGRSEEALEPEKEEKTFESDKSHEDSEEIHNLGNDMTHEEDNAETKESRSGEAGEASKELEDSKRWNKMDELAKELTSKKRMVKTESEEEEDPDRSMKIPYRARKYNFDSRERDVKRSWKHPSSEDSSERGLETAIRPSPEEKKEEEGSANRRTEDQELESLSAIEAELEKVAHKLIELRRG